MQWPDTDQPANYLKGFNVVFDVKDSGVFRPDEQPAEISKRDFEANNSRMVAKISEEIQKQAKSNDPTERERRSECWKRTKEEIAEGLVGQPRSRAQMDRKYKRGKWRCLGRSAIKQKGKWRCIDNGKRSKHNRATTMHERITCGRADFPATIAREFAKRHQQPGIRKRMRPFRMRHGTDDIKAAYRHVPTKQPQYTCVAVWNEDEGRVSYCDVPGHNFGLKSAVVNFYRFPELATIAARRLLWTVAEHYVDDFDTAEPEYANCSGQHSLADLCGDTFFGFPFDDSKHDSMDESNEYLGVVTDFSRIAEGLILMDVTKKRRKKIKDLISEIQLTQRLRSGAASSLFGKARFMMSPCFGCLGKACLQPIMAREHQRSTGEITPDLADSLEFIEFLCNHLPPTELPLTPSELEPVIIFTDAEGKKRDSQGAPTGHLGFVVYHPVFGRRYASAKAPDDWVRLFDSIKERDTYIGQFELAAAITPLLSLPPEWLAGRPVELWIDNSGAIGALIKGYSGVPDCARIVNMFHFACAKARIQSIWIDYVPSKSNPADLPSRFHEMTAAERMSALHDLGLDPARDQIDMRLPSFANMDGSWKSSTQVARSVWDI